jgi:glycerol-3-phosphate dehydrogenase
MSGRKALQLTSPPRFDVVVIGAGINGAGISRDAALRGLRVLVVEQSDLCAGTSAWSSRLIHGGLRYLEHAELGLVRESLAEREALLKIAPHLVKPVGMYVPVYRGGQRPLWKIRIGMWVYDLLSRGKSLPNHEMLSAAELLESMPGLAADKLTGGAQYFDAQCVYPERLVLENLVDAANHGAEVMLNTRVIKPQIEAGVVVGVVVEDAAGEQQTITASVVVNATGAWVDGVLDDLPLPKLIGGTKGSHLVIDRPLNMGAAAIYSEAQRDGRPFFIIPWNDMTLIGTTDRRFRGDPGEAAIDDDEFDYLLGEARRVLPRANLTAGDVSYCYCGVRPLPHRRRGAEGSITRRHLIKHHRRVAKGLISIVGGKLTTYRQLAEEVTDRVCRLLQHDAACTTRTRSLPGAGDEQDRQAVFDEGQQLGVTEPQLRQLWRVYGMTSTEILARIRSAPELAEELCPNSHVLLASLLQGLETEWASNLIDLLQRRNMAGLSQDFGWQTAQAGAAALQRLAIWDAPRVAEELAGYRQLGVRARARAIREAAPLGTMVSKR